MANTGRESKLRRKAQDEGVLGNVTNAYLTAKDYATSLVKKDHSSVMAGPHNLTTLLEKTEGGYHAG